MELARCTLGIGPARLRPCVALAALVAGCTVSDHQPAALTARRELWAIEQMPGGTVTVRDGVLVIDDADGCTAWLRQKLSAPVAVDYDATVIARESPHDRVSDVNCFWMATHPRSPEFMPAGRTGKFEDYDSLRTYYVGMGGNDNTTTRFRRYAGDGTKPLLPEYDLGEKRFLLEA